MEITTTNIPMYYIRLKSNEDKSVSVTVKPCINECDTNKRLPHRTGTALRHYLVRITYVWYTERDLHKRNPLGEPPPEVTTRI